MFLRVVAVLAALLVAATQAAQYIEVVTECPGHPGMCKDSTTGTFYANGATWRRGQECASYTCNFPNIYGESCGKVGVAAGCTLVEDNSKPYPHCCPKPSCPTS